MIFPDLSRFPNLTNNKMQTITLFSSETANTRAREDATFLRMPIKACSKCQFLEIYCRYRTPKWMDGFLSLLHFSPILYPKAETMVSMRTVIRMMVISSSSLAMAMVSQVNNAVPVGHLDIVAPGNILTGGMEECFFFTLSGHQNRLRKHPQGWTWPFYKGTLSDFVDDHRLEEIKKCLVVKL